MKKIAILPVKNEEWILEKCLACASVWADHIIVADQNSTDKTPDICAKFSQVVYLTNETVQFNEGARRQLLLDTARNFDGFNLIVFLSADEVLTANIIDHTVFESVFGCHGPGTGFTLQWPQLWRSERHYRCDGFLWTSRMYMPCAFIDDRQARYSDGFMHLSRIPEVYHRNVKVDVIKLLHYQFVDFERMLAKQRWYRLLEFKNANRRNLSTCFKLNRKYFLTKDESHIKLASVPREWLQGYPELAPNTASACLYDEQSLQLIKELGTERLKWLDIWDTDWEKKHQMIVINGAGDMSDLHITDCRGRLIRFYHNHQHCIPPEESFVALRARIGRSLPSWLKHLLRKV